jgi:hypothetical protein
MAVFNIATGTASRKKAAMPGSRWLCREQHHEKPVVYEESQTGGELLSDGTDGRADARR